MAVLTVDVGGSPITLDCEHGGHAPPRRVGPISVGNSGAEESSVRAELMVIPVVLAPLSTSALKAVRDLFALGAQVPCSGDVFNTPGTIVCSGAISDELHETGDRWTANLTLYEIGQEVAYSPCVAQFLLTNVDSPDSADPTVFVSTPSGSYPGDVSTTQPLLAGVDDTDLLDGFGVPVLVDPPTPDIAWLSVPLTADIVSGTPYVRFETAMSGVYSGATVWAVMDVRAEISQVRDDGLGGFDTIAGPFTTNYVGVQLGGGLARIDCTSAVVLVLQTNDRLLVEFYPRLLLQSGHTDNGQRQNVSRGTIPGPRPLPLLVVDSCTEAA